MPKAVKCGRQDREEGARVMSEVFFNGVDGRIEGRFHRSENPRSPLVLVLHPHPGYGGTMNNRVTYAMYQAFVNMGFSALRINYRGVGHSQGMIDGTGTGELADAIVALDWLQSMDTETNVCWIAGYSFGAYIAAQVLMRRPEIKGFVFVTPPVNQYNFDFLSPCPASGLIIQGTKDDFVPENRVNALSEQLNAHNFVEVLYQPISGADHIYSKHLKQVYDTIVKTVPQIKLKRIQKNGRRVKRVVIPNDDYWPES